MIIHVDISGQINQVNKDSALGFKRSDGKTNCVKIRSTSKKALRDKFKGQVFRLPEKLYCILIYYCIRDYLTNVETIVICNDENFQRVAYLLPFLFKGHMVWEKIRLMQKREGKSEGHYPALKGYRSNRNTNKIITADMVEKKLFEFK